MLKPINSRNSNSKLTQERSQENIKTLSISPKANKKDFATTRNIDNTSQSNQYKQQNIKNHSSELLNTSREEQHKYKQQSKISSGEESDYEPISDNEHGKSQKNKSKTHTVSMGNQRYTENSRNENEKSKLDSKRDSNPSTQIKGNNYDANMEEELNYDDNKNEEVNNDYLEKGKRTPPNEENIEAENSDNYNDINNNDKANVSDNENKNEKGSEDIQNPEIGLNEDQEPDAKQEQEKKDHNANEIIMEKSENRIENKQEENIGNEEENSQVVGNKEENKVEAAQEN